MTILSIDSLLLSQIDDSPDDDSSYFTDSEAVNYPIYDENLNDSRQENQERIEVYNLFGSTEDVAKYYDEPNGVYQISLFVETNAGKGNSFRIAQEIKERYTRVVSGSPDLNVQTISVNTPRVEGSLYRVDLSVNYFYFEQVN